ncbi:MAG: glucans biosynthesis glucosyltransferase MdoH [Moraxellaceae bacterium]
MDQHHSGPVSGLRFGPSMPPLQRGAMVAQPWQGFIKGLFTRACPQAAATVTAAVIEPWEKAARARRRALLMAIALVALGATFVLSLAQPAYEHPWLQHAQTVLFALLFAWVAAGCITAVMGFVALLRGDTHMLSKNAALQGALDVRARTAVIMPICNEEVATVFAGLRATCESLAAHPDAAHFDIYILSDSSDPALRAAELAAWAELRSSLGNDRIFYRWRQLRRKRKAGNVADFCRRWGRSYRYMVVLDADSVMSGDCLSTLLRLMEAHPKAGILQTVPQACGHATLHARSQQFSSRVTGRLFTAGMQYWQLGEAHYWGHNAIIRVAPFMQHCALAKLPGKGGLSGDILSHDFVEAALMRRAGYQVWLVPDLEGSYEQQPPNLLAELQRDRRWCQGNLQNSRLITEPGLHGVHRAMLFTGAMAYLSAPLWLCYLLLGTLLWLLGGHVTFSAGAGLAVLGLWTGTLTMLVLPRALGVLAVLLKKEQHLYGGGSKLVQSACTEALLSSLQAPLRMMAHSLFVFVALTGWKLEWVSPPREASSVSWREAAQRFATPGLIVLAAMLLLGAINAPGLLWLTPVALPLLLAIPFTVWSSRPDLGARLRAQGLLLIPEETATPAVLQQSWAYMEKSASTPGWQDMLHDARLSALASAAMGNRHTARGLRGNRRREWLAQLVAQGEALSASGCMRLLSEPNTLRQWRAAVLFPAQPVTETGFVKSTMASGYVLPVAQSSVGRDAVLS